MWSNGAHPFDLCWRKHMLWIVYGIVTRYCLVQSSITFTLYSKCSWDSWTTFLSLLEVTLQNNHSQIGEGMCEYQHASLTTFLQKYSFSLNKYKYMQACGQSTHTIRLVNLVKQKESIISIFYNDTHYTV